MTTIPTDPGPLPREHDVAPAMLRIGSGWSTKDLANRVEIHLPSGTVMFRLTADEARRIAALLIKHAGRINPPAAEAM